jgi:hypothetical protein
MQRETLSARLVRQLNEMTAKQPGWRVCPLDGTGYDRTLVPGGTCPECARPTCPACGEKFDPAYGCGCGA